MSNTELFCRKSENLAKRELLITIMEDMRLIGNINLHLKYLEMYESLKSENIEIKEDMSFSLNKTDTFNIYFCSPKTTLIQSIYLSQQNEIQTIR